MDTENPILAHLAAHASVRDFDSSPVADEVIESCVRAAQQAATSSHVQAYSLLQITNAATREELAELTGGQKQVAMAGAFFVLAGDQRRHRLAAERAGKSYAPNLETFMLATIDASLFAQNLVLAFEAFGLGTCYIGGLRTKLAEVDRLLALPDDCLPLFGLCVGTPAARNAPRPRLPLSNVLFKDAYPSDETLLAGMDKFDRVMEADYEARGLIGRNWSGGVIRKFERATRAELHDYYTSKGARLE